MTRTPANPRDNVEPFAHLADERLVDLALEEAMDAAEREHMGTCGPCREVLASLRRTVDVAREASAVEMVSPGRELWSRIVSDIDAPESGQRDAPLAAVPASLQQGATPDVAVLPAPDESSSSPEVVVPLRRNRGDAGGRQRAAGRGRPARGWLAAACAVGVLLGAGGFVAADRFADDPAPTVATRTVATAELDTLDTAQWVGRATVSERASSVTLEVAVRALEPADGGCEGPVRPRPLLEGSPEDLVGQPAGRRHRGAHASSGRL